MLEHSFALNHAAAEGHFPGDPIIPGAALLSEVLLAIGSDLGRRLRPCHVKVAKFIHPVRPGDCVAIEYAYDGNGIRFKCRAGGKMVLAGEVRCAEQRVEDAS